MKTEKEQLKEQLAKLHSDNAKLHSKITRVVNKIQKIEQQESDEIGKKIPKNPHKISKEQWKFILEHHNSTPKGQYKIAQKVLTDIGLFASGFLQQTQQFNFAYHWYEGIVGIKTAKEENKKLKKTINGLLLVLPHYNMYATFDKTKVMTVDVYTDYYDRKVQIQIDAKKRMRLVDFKQYREPNHKIIVNWTDDYQNLFSIVHEEIINDRERS